MGETKLTRDDAYEEMASTYQCLQIDALNNALKENGVDDVALRRKVCEQFTFAMGNLHDQHWFDSEGQRVHPLLCFSPRFLNTDTDVTQLGDVYAPSDMYAFHEYAFGNNAWYFDEQNEDASEIQHGVFEGDDQT